MVSSLMQWPHELLVPSALVWSIDGGFRSGGRSLGDTELRADITGGGFWRCSMQNIRQIEEDQVLAYRALIARCRHGIAPIVVPVLDMYKPFHGTSPRRLSTVPFFAGQPYEPGQEHLVTHIEANFSENASAGATRVRISRPTGNSMRLLRSGEYFSVDHSTWGRRLYMVLEIEESTFEGANWWVQIAPRLRQNVSSGDAVDFATPSCEMVLQNAREAAQSIETPFVGSGSPIFTEYTPPR